MNIRPVPGWNAKVNGLRRPMAQIARFTPVVGVEERVVGGDRAVGIDPEDLAEQVVQGLGVGAVGVLADADVELAVGSEVDRAPVMVGGGR